MRGWVLPGLFFLSWFGVGCGDDGFVKYVPEKNPDPVMSVKAPREKNKRPKLVVDAPVVKKPYDVSLSPLARMMGFGYTNPFPEGERFPEKHRYDFSGAPRAQSPRVVLFRDYDKKSDSPSEKQVFQTIDWLYTDGPLRNREGRFSKFFYGMNEAAWSIRNGVYDATHKEKRLGAKDANRGSGFLRRFFRGWRGKLSADATMNDQQFQVGVEKRFGGD